MGKPAKKRAKKGPNSRVLTVKDLSEREYAVIHKLPHGTRALTHKALLVLAAEFARKRGQHWDEDLRSGRVKLVGKRG